MTKEELKALRAEYEALYAKLMELDEDELKQVNSGAAFLNLYAGKTEASKAQK